MLTTLLVAAILQAPNTLTQAEVKAGWKLLFDGKTTNGWHNFKGKGVSAGWRVKDGVLTSYIPETAGDIVTDEKFDWFELTLDYNLTKGGNSGIMFRVVEDGEAAWHSGPEVQIYDHAPGPDIEISGYLYQLYKPNTHADKPAGEWNHLRILVSPKVCETEMNGVKYYEYVFGSKDFWDRVAKTKFSEFPQFAKADKGSIAIQGDHGVVSFRNLKIRPIKG